MIKISKSYAALFKPMTEFSKNAMAMLQTGPITVRYKDFLGRRLFGSFVITQEEVVGVDFAFIADLIFDSAPKNCETITVEVKNDL
jgi:hypothetical protein